MVLSKLIENFSTSMVTFELSLNFSISFRSFQLITLQVLILSSCPFQQHVSQEIYSGVFALTEAEIKWLAIIRNAVFVMNPWRHLVNCSMT